MRSIHILIVDDNSLFLKVIGDWLTSVAGIGKVDRVATGAEALTRVERDVQDLVLAGLRLPDMDGFELAHRIRSCAGPATVVIMTGIGFPESAHVFTKANGNRYMDKMTLYRELPRFLSDQFGIPSPEG